jgi:hypothetical protein
MDILKDLAEEEARFRIGDVSSIAFDQRDIEYERQRRPGYALFGYDGRENCVLSANKWNKRLEWDPEGDVWRIPEDFKNPSPLHSRNWRLANELSDLGFNGRIFADMRDAVYESDASVPIFQYNRKKQAQNSILWPLYRVHHIGAKDFFGNIAADEVPFSEKAPCIFWRGNLVGYSTLNGKPEHTRVLIKRFLNGEITEDLLAAHLETVPRYQFVKRFANDSRVDAGFVFPKRHEHFTKIRLISPFVRDTVDRQEYLRHRYVIALSGADVSTVFGWAPCSNSLILKENYDFEVFFDCHFKDGRDFLFVNRDFDDVIEKMEWAESHLAECEEMIAHAKKRAGLLGRFDYRRMANEALLSLYREKVLRG